MRMRTVLALALASGLAGTAAVGLAQQPSLAEVARQEAARRKAVEASKKVYTNQDVARGRPLTTGAVAKPANAPAAEASVASDDAQPADGTATPATDDAKAPAKVDEARVAELKNALAAITTAARIAQTAVDKANINIVNLFDEAQRTTAAAGRDASLAEYRKLAAEIDALNKQIADLEAGASKAEGPKKQ